jgi:hypothetical protein
MTDNLAHCLKLARRHGYTAYLCCLNLKPALRAQLLPLIALDAELQQIAGKVQEQMLAQLRYAWWRDALSSGNVPGHPVLMALRDSPMSSDLLEAMVNNAEDAWPHPPTPLSPALQEAGAAALAHDQHAQNKWINNLTLARRRPGPLLPLRLLLARG